MERFFMIKIENEKKLLDELRKNRQFLSTHGVVKKFNEACNLDKGILDFDLNIFSKITQNNLIDVNKILNWKWKYVIQYNITHNRHGYFVYGIGKDNCLVNYHRKETRNPVAGQTVFHIENKSFQVNTLLKNKFKGKDSNIIKKLLELSDSLEFEKKIFERI